MQWRMHGSNHHPKSTVYTSFATSVVRGMCTSQKRHQANMSFSPVCAYLPMSPISHGIRNKHSLSACRDKKTIRRSPVHKPRMNSPIAIPMGIVSGAPIAV